VLLFGARQLKLAFAGQLDALITGRLA
jgi:hypothetical protein